ncbi:MAG TPA: glycosyltransferase [Solirubrobacteraceae bacterium]|nr:glycosyltransferase [Solirubrobacteraceae bacterium]
MRALIVTNMYPSRARPWLGSFVADQVAALRRTGEAEVEVFAFDPGGARAYARAARSLRAHAGSRTYDIVHAHYGLSAWPALAARARRRVVTLHGTDLAHPRARPLTLAALGTCDLVAAVSRRLAETIPAWMGRDRVAILPCGVDLGRFAPIDRRRARELLGLPPDGPYLLFPSDPARSEKRHDRALAVAGDVPLLTLRGADRRSVPLLVNAANAVLVCSEREGFGLAVLEALACNVPVLATPVGIHPEALAGIEGTLCAPFSQSRWRAALEPHLALADPRVAGRSRAERWSSDAMAQLVLKAWRELLGR